MQQHNGRKYKDSKKAEILISIGYPQGAPDSYYNTAFQA